MMEVTCHADVPDVFLLDHQVEQILGLIVGLQRFLVVIALLVFGGH